MSNPTQALTLAKNALLEGQTGTFNDWATHYYKTQKPRLLHDIEIVQQLAKPGMKVLDIGCAPFFTTLALKSLGTDITGVDIDPDRFTEMLAQSGLEVKKCNFETERLPFEDASFDVILFAEVFEHLRIDLISTMNEIKRVLKPGGVLLLSTPNFWDFSKLFVLFLKGETAPVFKAYEKLATLGHMGHVREYTPADVRKFMKPLGFRCEKTIFRGVPPFRWRPAAIVRWPLQKVFPKLRQWFMLVLVKK